ncbi:MULTISPECIES: autotransporter domain-containing protein [unclassified Martelella]|uniref:autotransporter domain-containing protein n=1 Tax=unclassified Martelella TaxID=2629616 RepID=UPI0025BAFCD9|nr:autotransporter domain-containing protein [Martelella sp.]
MSSTRSRTSHARRVRRLLCGAALIGSVAMPIGAHAADEGKGTVRVLTFNTYRELFSGDDASMKAFLEAGDYDVIGLQELCYYASQCTYMDTIPEMLAGQGWSNAAGYRDGEDGVVTRFAGEGGSHRWGNYFSGQFAYVTADASEGLPQTTYASAHFDWRNEPETYRISEAKQVNSWVLDHNNPVILMGDLNAGDVSERGLSSALQQAYLYTRVIYDAAPSQLWRDLVLEYAPEGREDQAQAYIDAMRATDPNNAKHYRNVLQAYFDAHPEEFPGISKVSDMSWEQWAVIIQKDMAANGLVLEDETYPTASNQPVTMNILKKQFIALNSDSTREGYAPHSRGDGSVTWPGTEYDEGNITSPGWAHGKIDHFLASRPYGKWWTVVDAPDDDYLGVLNGIAVNDDGKALSDHELVAHEIRWVGPVLEAYEGDASKKTLIWSAEANTFAEDGGVFQLTRNNMRTDMTIGQISDDDGNPIFTDLPVDVLKTKLDCESGEEWLQDAIAAYCIDDHSFIGETLITDGGTIIVDEDLALGNADADLRLNNGTLAIAGTAMPTLDRNVVLEGVGGTLHVSDAAASVTAPGTISGEGALTKAGDGTLVLAGANTYAGGTFIESGTLGALGGAALPDYGTVAIAENAWLALGNDETIGGLTGAGSVDTGSAMLTVGADGSTTAFAGAIAGSGGLTKTGGGALNLTGVHAYSGETFVNGGALFVNGSIAASSLTTVNDGGLLGGNGVLGSLRVAGGGTLSPGNSIGMLTVQGDVTFEQGSNFIVEVDADGYADKVVASGTATIHGGTMATVAANGNYQAGARYAVLVADDGVTGAFDSVTTNMAFLTPSFDAASGQLVLSTERNDTPYAFVGTTQNRKAVAAAIDGLGGGGLYDSIVGLDAGTADYAFNQLSGELYPSVTAALAEDSHFFRDAVTARFAGGAAVDTGTGVGTGTDGRFSVWSHAYGAHGSLDGNDVATLDRNTGGFYIGGDAALSDAFTLGAMAGYGRSSFSLDGQDASADTNSYLIGVYGAASLDAFRLTFGGAYAFNDTDARRAIDFGSLSDNLTASYDGSVSQVFAEAAYRIDFAGGVFEPYLGLAQVHAETDGFTENGGIAALSAGDSDMNVTYMDIGLRASKTFAIGERTASVNGQIGWRHAFGDITPEMAMAIAGSTPFTIEGTPINENAAIVNAGLNFNLAENANLYVNYVGQFSDGGSENGVNAGLKIRF